LEQDFKKDHILGLFADSPRGRNLLYTALLISVLMSQESEHSSNQKDENEIRDLFDRWIRAVRAENFEGIRADHDPEILMFDVPPPFLSKGLDAYMATWKLFISMSKKPVVFDFRDVQIVSGKEVAFVTAIGSCSSVDAKGPQEDLEFRLTMGLRKVNGAWRVVHEHHSVPAE
jgi:uncharacterized protein (TIGR02246 family)